MRFLGLDTMRAWSYQESLTVSLSACRKIKTVVGAGAGATAALGTPASGGTESSSLFTASCTESLSGRSQLAWSLTTSCAATKSAPTLITQRRLATKQTLCVNESKNRRAQMGTMTGRW